MNIERGVFDSEETPEQTAAADARALEAVRSGRVVPHEKVVEWLETWGKPDRKPFPREWFE